MLEVDIRKDFGKFKLNVSFSADRGITGLLGASGCGKSMTLKCVAGIVTPDAGRIVLDGRVLFDSGKRVDLSPQERRVGYLFQNYALFPNMTVAQNIAAGVRGRDRARREAMVADMVKSFYLEDLERKYPRQLSGGQQQRVALARILASEPHALLLDEPFSALDSYLRWQVELELGELLSPFPGPVLFVTHSRDEVYRMCENVCVLDHGRSQPEQDVHTLFDSPATVSSCLLTGCKNLSRAVPGPDGRVACTDWGVSLDPGRDIPEGTTHVGVRSHYLRPVEAPGENTIPCTVERVIDDVFSTVVLLSTPGGGEGYSRLRLELPKEAWAALSSRDSLCLQIRPEELLLLKD